MSLQLKHTSELISRILSEEGFADFSVSSTLDNETQVYRKLPHGNLYLLVDEYGGIALSFIGKPGQSCNSSYIEGKNVNLNTIIEASKLFRLSEDGENREGNVIEVTLGLPPQ